MWEWAWAYLVWIHEWEDELREFVRLLLPLLGLQVDINWLEEWLSCNIHKLNIQHMYIFAYLCEIQPNGWLDSGTGCRYGDEHATLMFNVGSRWVWANVIWSIKLYYVVIKAIIWSASTISVTLWCQAMMPHMIFQSWAIQLVWCMSVCLLASVHKMSTTHEQNRMKSSFLQQYRCIIYFIDWILARMILPWMIIAKDERLNKGDLSLYCWIQGKNLSLTAMKSMTWA